MGIFDDATGPTLYATSDVHIAYPENRLLVAELEPTAPDDWLIVAGDVGELVEDIEWALRSLRERFGTVVWAPGNHELWTPPNDPVRLRGVERYQHLVEICRRIGVLTPEDPYPVWQGAGGPAVIAPLFVLYDYTFRAPGTTTKEESLARAYETGVVCNDEFRLHPDPYRRDRAPAGSDRRRPAGGPGQPLPADSRTDPGVVVPGVRAVVRHRAHRRLAPPVPCHRRRLRSPAHTTDNLARRRPVRGGLAGLPAGVAASRRPAAPASPDPAAATGHRGPEVRTLALLMNGPAPVRARPDRSGRGPAGHS